MFKTGFLCSKSVNEIEKKKELKDKKKKNVLGAERNGLLILNFLFLFLSSCFMPATLSTESYL